MALSYLRAVILQYNAVNSELPQLFNVLIEGSFIMSEITGYPKGMSDKDKNNAADDRLNWKHQDKSYNELYKF